jgi:hypothetical protein
VSTHSFSFASAFLCASLLTYTVVWLTDQTLHHGFSFLLRTTMSNWQCSTVSLAKLTAHVEMTAMLLWQQSLRLSEMTADRAPFAGTVPTDPLPSMGEVWSASDRPSLERLNWRPEGGGSEREPNKILPERDDFSNKSNPAWPNHFSHSTTQVG